METRWEPDTCGCIYIVKDWELPDVHCEKICLRHNVSGAMDVDKFKMSHADNKLCQEILSDVLQNIPSLLVEEKGLPQLGYDGAGNVIPIPGESNSVMRPGLSYQAKYNKYNVLTILFPGATSQEQDQIDERLKYTQSHRDLISIHAETLEATSFHKVPK